MRKKYELMKDCARVNELLKAQAKQLGLGTKRSLARLSDCENDARAFHAWALLEFTEFCRRKLEGHTSVSASYLRKEGASKLKLATITTQRYMEKLRTEKGPLGGMGDIVTLNPNYVPSDEDDYWLEETQPAGQEETEEV